MFDANNLQIPPGYVVSRPMREPDHYSKRGVAYWWTPEWVRGTDSYNSSFSRIIPLKVDINNSVNRYQYRNEDTDGVAVELYMLSKSGSMSFIRGSIQKEFIKWHIDNQINHILLGLELDDILNTKWKYDKVS